MKYKICVSGSAVTDICPPEVCEKAKEVGREIIRQDGIIVTGATTGIPYEAAIGAKEEGGMSIGLSPASSEREHVKKYHLPVDAFDLIIYTGFEYAGRNLLLTRTADAVIIACGRIGTINEFTIAFEEKKPIGILEGSGGTVDEIRDLVSKAKRGHGKIIYSSDPKELVAKVVEMIKKEKGETQLIIDHNQLTHKAPVTDD